MPLVDGTVGTLCSNRIGTWVSVRAHDRKGKVPARGKATRANGMLRFVWIGMKAGQKLNAMQFALLKRILAICRGIPTRPSAMDLPWRRKARELFQLLARWARPLSWGPPKESGRLAKVADPSLISSKICFRNKIFRGSRVSGTGATVGRTRRPGCGRTEEHRSSLENVVRSGLPQPERDLRSRVPA